MFSDEHLVGYTRLVPAGLSYPEMAIGRVVTAPSVRGLGLGRKLMESSIQYCRSLFGLEQFESAPKGMR